MPSILPQRKEGGVVLVQENEEAVQIMPADEIEEAFFGVIFGHVVSFVGKILWDLVCFYIGLSVIKLVTIGKEGKPAVTQEIFTSRWVSLSCLLE